MREYQTAHTQKQKEELKKLTMEEATLKAIADAPIDLEGMKPEEAYKAILERIERSSGILRIGWDKPNFRYPHFSIMEFTIDKKRMLHAIDQLPDDATVLDAIDQLLLLYKIQKGLNEEGGIPQEEIEREFFRKERIPMRR